MLYVIGITRYYMMHSCLMWFWGEHCKNAYINKWIQVYSAIYALNNQVNVKHQKTKHKKTIT